MRSRQKLTGIELRSFHDAPTLSRVRPEVGPKEPRLAMDLPIRGGEAGNAFWLGDGSKFNTNFGQRESGVDGEEGARWRPSHVEQGLIRKISITLPLLVELPISLGSTAFLLSRVCAFIHTTAVEPLSLPDGRESTPK